MLLDSDDEEDNRFGEEDGMIEKDMDNWIWLMNVVLIKHIRINNYLK